MLVRLGLSGRDLAEKRPQADGHFGVVVVNRRNSLPHRDPAPQFLVDLSLQGGLPRLPFLDFPARKLPLPGEMLALGPLAHEDTSLTDNHGADDVEHIPVLAQQPQRDNARFRQFPGG